jgi:hypothetical protein
MHCKEFGVVETSGTDRSPVMMVVSCPDVMRIHIENVLSTYRQSTASLVFLADSFREKPIQNTMINVEGGILDEEISEFTDAKPVPILVQFQESAVV